MYSPLVCVIRVQFLVWEGAGLYEVKLSSCIESANNAGTQRLLVQCSHHVSPDNIGCQAGPSFIALYTICRKRECYLV